MRKKKVISEPSALQRADSLEHPVIIAPFGKGFIPVVARELSFVQIKSCGEFSLIETFQERIEKKDQKELSFHQIVEYSELMHNVVRLSLLSPSCDDIIKTVLKYDNIDNIDKQLSDIKEMFLKMKKESPDKKDELEALQNEYARIELQYKYVLPDNFLNYMFCFALGIDSSDIKKVSEDMLYSAAVKAKLGNDNPADHMSGDFTDFNKEDINDRAWVIYFDKEKEKRENEKLKNGAK